MRLRRCVDDRVDLLRLKNIPEREVKQRYTCVSCVFRVVSTRGQTSTWRHISQLCVCVWVASAAYLIRSAERRLPFTNLKLGQFSTSLRFLVLLQ